MCFFGASERGSCGWLKIQLFYCVYGVHADEKFFQWSMSVFTAQLFISSTQKKTFEINNENNFTVVTGFL